MKDFEIVGIAVSSLDEALEQTQKEVDEKVKKGLGYYTEDMVNKVRERQRNETVNLSMFNTLCKKLDK